LVSISSVVGPVQNTLQEVVKWAEGQEPVKQATGRLQSTIQSFRVAVLDKVRSTEDDMKQVRQQRSPEAVLPRLFWRKRLHEESVVLETLAREIGVSVVLTP